MGYILNYGNWRRLNEEAAATALDIYTGVVVCGANKAPTNNFDAVKKLKAAGCTVNGTISSTTCITREALADSKTFTVSKKTVDATDYLKVGNVVISGSETSTILLNILQVQGAKIEAAGNGIYAFGRALVAAEEAMTPTYNLPNTAGVLIVLNSPTVDTRYFNIKSGFQQPMLDWGAGAAEQLIASGAIEPTGVGYATGMIADAKSRKDPANVLTMWAMPLISTGLTPEERETLKTTIGVIDTSGFTHNGKKAADIDSAKTIAKSFNTLYQNKFVESIGTKFREFIRNKTSPSGIPEEALAPIFKIINNFVKKEKGKIAEYEESLLGKMDVLYGAYHKTGTSQVTGAMSGVSTVTGKVGQIAPTQKP